MSYDVQVSGNGINGGYLFDALSLAEAKVKELVSQGVPPCDITINKHEKDINGDPVVVDMTDNIMRVISKDNKVGCGQCEYSRFEAFKGFSCSKGHKEEYKFLAHVWCEDYEYMKAPF